jgi:iron complex outermembrane receptor protein
MTKIRDFYERVLKVIIAFGLVFALPQVTYAAEERLLEEIIVTGTKREASAQDIPIALTAISDEQLRSTFRTDIMALTDMAPSVVIGQMAGFRAITGGIRGTGQNSILVTQDASVVLLLDELGMSNVQAQFVELFDVEQIEIYRGPQGTLFGKSSTGGAISITTKRPVMNEFSADMSLQYGTFDGDDVPDTAAIKKYRASVNLPLTDTLALRIAGIWDEDDGYYSNSKSDSSQYNGLIAAFGAPLPEWANGPSVGGGENLGGTDVFAAKVKLLWQPTDNYEAYFIYSHLDDDSDSVPAVQESEDSMLVPLFGFPPNRDNLLETGSSNACWGEAFCVQNGHQVDVEQYQLHQTYTMDNLTWKLIWAHREMAEILPSSYAGEAFLSIFDASRNTSKDTDQLELRVSSTFDGPFNFVAGVSRVEEETAMLAYATVGLLSFMNFVDPDPNSGDGGSVFSVLGGAADGIPLLNADGTLALETDYITDPTMTGATQERTTTAAYFDFSYDLTDLWTLTAGVRYTKDEKDFFRRQNPGGLCTAQTPAKDAFINPDTGECRDRRSNSISRVGGGFTMRDAAVFNLPLPDSVFDIALRTDEEWSETTYRILVNRSIGDDAMAYASYSTGFISGGFTETCSSVNTCQPFDPETNENWEIGFKGQFLNNTLQTNVAIYLTKYEDLIRSQVLPFTNAFGALTQETVNFNAGKSEIEGAEAEIAWYITPNLRLNVNLSVLDHEYTDFVVDGADLSDFDVPFSPELQYGIALTYEHEIMDGKGSLVWNTSIAHLDENETSVFNSPFTQMDERDLWDANVTYHEAEGRYSIALWGKNLTDERSRNAGNSVSVLWNMTNYARPRSFGMEFSVHL